MTMKNEVISMSDILDVKAKMIVVRGQPVLLDRDVAALYGVETRALNQSVKRNAGRFPSEFMFLLDASEMGGLVTNCDRFKMMKHSSSPMRAFNEHGVIMLANVLKSESAVRTSVQIVRAFVAMRRALASMVPMMARLDAVERRQIADQTRNDENQARNEERFEMIFKAMNGDDFPPQKVFFDGRHYDAYSFAKKLVRKAAKGIVLVDGYCDDVTLDILSCKRAVSKLDAAFIPSILARI